MYIETECTNGTIESFESTPIEILTQEAQESQIAQNALKPHMTEKTKRADVSQSIENSKKALNDPTLSEAIKRSITTHLEGLERTLRNQNNPNAVMVDFSPKSMKPKRAKRVQLVVKRQNVKKAAKPTHTQKGQRIVRATFSK